MKPLWLLIGCLFLLAACTGSAYRDEAGCPLWERMDSLLPVRADSARLLLLQVRVDSLQEEGDKARYALLQTEAAIRCGRPLADDSLILSAVDYYDRAGDAGMQARAHYWAGNAYCRLQEEEKALQQYWQAEELAHEAEDRRLLGVIYNNWAYLYVANGLMQEADSLYGLAGQIAMQRNDSLLWGESLCRRGVMAIDKGKTYYPMAEKLLLQGYGIAEKLDNQQLQRTATSFLSTFYARLGKGEESLRYAKENWALQSDTLHCYSTFSLLGAAYYRCACYDSAVYFMNKALPATDAQIQSNAYMRLADIAKLRGDYVLSMEMERKYSACVKSNQEMIRRQGHTLLDAITNLQMTRVQAKSRQVWQWVYVGVAVMVFVMALGAWKIWQWRKSSRQIALQGLQEAHPEQLAKKEKLPAALTEEEKALWKGEFEHSVVYGKIMRIISDCDQHEESQEKMNEEDWLQLEDYLNRRWKGVCLRLQKNEKMNLEDIHLCCLYLVGLSVIQIAYVFGYTRDGIYKMSKRILKDKIGVVHQEGNLKDFLLRFSGEA